MTDVLGIVGGGTARDHAPPRIVSSTGIETALREWLRSMPLVEASYHRARRRLTEVFEREYLHWLLDRAGDQLSRAARVAGVDRTTLYRMMERRGLRRRASADETPAAD